MRFRQSQLDGSNSLDLWIWVVLFVLLTIVGLGVLVLILWQLRNKAMALVAELTPLMESLDTLQRTMSASTDAEPVHSAIDDNPAQHLITLRDIKKSKAKRKQARERRLIRGLNARKQEKL